MMDNQTLPGAKQGGHPDASRSKTRWQAGRNAQDAWLCTPGPFFSRDTEFKV